jgi:hypothetical protein
MADQNAWRYCQKCHVLFYDGYADKGVCKAGGGHIAQGFMFYLPWNISSADPNTTQDQWRYCGKCHALFYDGYTPKGVCPAGDGHEAAGWTFIVPHDVGASANMQDEWRFCDKCHSMFYDGYTPKGVCPAGDEHHAQGFMFDLPHDIPDTLHFDANSIVMDGVPVGGNAHLAIERGGTYTFSGHFHDAGWPSYDTNCAVGVRDSTGNLFIFPPHSGRTHGTDESGSRNDNWSASGMDKRISDYWATLAGNSSANFQSAVNISVGALFSWLSAGGNGGDGPPGDDQICYVDDCGPGGYGGGIEDGEGDESDDGGGD